MATFEDFKEIDIRVGKILSAQLLLNTQHTTHKIIVDFGEEVGTKISGARLTNYSLDELHGKYVAAIINLPPKQIGSLLSEILILGFPDKNDEAVLIEPSVVVPLGGKLY